MHIDLINVLLGELLNISQENYTDVCKEYTILSNIFKKAGRLMGLKFFLIQWD